MEKPVKYANLEIGKIYRFKLRNGGEEIIGRLNELPLRNRPKMHGTRLSSAVFKDVSSGTVYYNPTMSQTFYEQVVPNTPKESNKKNSWFSRAMKSIKRKGGKSKTRKVRGRKTTYRRRR